MNKVHAISRLFPDAVQGRDFDVYSHNGEQYIALWKLDEPEPTEEELQQAYEDYQANPPKKERSQLESLQETVDKLVLSNLEV